MLLKKIFWFWWRKKKKSDSEFLSYNLMLNSGKKIRVLHAKKINILTLVLFEKKFLNETKNHNPPMQVKWSVPYVWNGMLCTKYIIVFSLENSFPIVFSGEV